MTQNSQVVALAQALVALDSRSSRSNIAVAERIEQALGGFEIERLDYVDPGGIAKRALVARRDARSGSRQSGGLALSGHMDTVPDTGWTTDPWSGAISDGRLHGLGSTDMKGPLAACIIAAAALPPEIPVMLLITADEETTKAGARIIAAKSALVRRHPPAAILVAEPTRLGPVRGHRSSINFTAVATGLQAHSSTGQGRNANWQLADFLLEMRDIHRRLRDDTSLHDEAYDPPFSDFNLIIDNHGAALNVTVPIATVRIKFRHSAGLDPAPIVAAVQAAAGRAGVALSFTTEGKPPELPSNHPLIRLCTEATGRAARTAPYGTDASELQSIAPCVILGPGNIDVAHKPGESISIDDLEAAVPMFETLCRIVAAQAP